MGHAQAADCLQASQAGTALCIGTDRSAGQGRRDSRRLRRLQILDRRRDRCAVDRAGSRCCHGPVQSKGMCLDELVVQCHLKSKASTVQTVDLPQVASCGPGPVSQPGEFMSCGYLPGRLVGPVSALAHAFTFPAISTPQWARSGAISNVMLRPLDSALMSTFGKKRRHLRRKPADPSLKNQRKRLGLARVGALIDEEASSSLGLPRPEITVPPTNPHETETVEIDVTIVAAFDVPEENGLAKAIVRGLRESAGTCNRAAAVVEPISADVPLWDIGHDPLRYGLRWRRVCVRGGQTAWQL